MRIRIKKSSLFIQLSFLIIQLFALTATVFAQLIICKCSTYADTWFGLVHLNEESGTQTFIDTKSGCYGYEGRNYITTVYSGLTEGSVSGDHLMVTLDVITHFYDCEARSLSSLVG